MLIEIEDFMYFSGRFAVDLNSHLLQEVVQKLVLYIRNEYAYILCVNVLFINTSNWFYGFFFFAWSLVNRDSEVSTKADLISLVAATFLGRHQ